MVNILVYGTGRFYQQYRKWLTKVHITAFLDTDINKQGAALDGAVIMSPEDGVKLEYDYVYILSTYYDSMLEKLLSLGVEQSRIKSFRNLLALGVKPVYKEYGSLSAQGNTHIVVFSHELSLIGAPIVLFYAVEILQQQGYDVTVASSCDGSLRRRYRELGIHVIVDERLDFETMNDINWLKHYTLAFVNSIDWTYLLSERPDDLPVIWWLHEENSCYTALVVGDMQRIDRKNLYVYAVSNKAKRCVESYMQDIRANLLLYGIPDEYISENKEHILRFAVVGSVIPRKGQDVFLRAIEKLQYVSEASCEYWIIGDDSSLYARELQGKYDGRFHISFQGECDRMRIMELYSGIDVVVCTSREDPMPVVVAEAAMQGKAAIVSTATGYADSFPQDFEKCIFPVDDVQALSTAMLRFINDAEILLQTRAKMRKFYVQNFSLEAFRKKLLSIIDEVRYYEKAAKRG